MSIFSKIKEALKKTKDKIADVFSSVFRIDRIGDEFYDELLDALIASDISVNVAMDVVDILRDKMIEGKVKDKEEVVRCLKEALIEKLDEGGRVEMKFPCVIMVVGVNGVGKTTSIGKMASYFLKQGKTVTIAAADTFRAAASDQLAIWADRANVRIIKYGEGADPSAVVFDAISSAKAKNTDVVIIDTAGRLHVKANLMEELKKMNRVVEREWPGVNFYKLICLDATTGNNALSQVKMFNEAVDLDGFILSKLDGTAKGGFIISLCSEYEIPVWFVGVGEKIDDLELFDNEEYIGGLF